MIDKLKFHLKSNGELVVADEQPFRQPDKDSHWTSPLLMCPSKEKIDVFLYDLARAGIHEDEVNIVLQFIEDTHREYTNKINRLKKLWKNGVRI